MAASVEEMCIMVVVKITWELLCVDASFCHDYEKINTRKHIITERLRFTLQQGSQCIGKYSYANPNTFYYFITTVNCNVILFV